MGILETISSAIGTGGFGAVAAGGIYAGAGAIEKEATADAKRDIAKFLKGFGSYLEVSFVARHMSDMFDIIFGARHFSVKCASRSILATTTFLSLCFLYVGNRNGFQHWNGLLQEKHLNEYQFEPMFFALFVVLVISIPDYIALGKSRVILGRIARQRRIFSIAAYLAIDVLLSFVIITVYLSMFSFFNNNSLQISLSEIKGAPAEMVMTYSSLLSNDRTIPPSVLFGLVLFTSTILTSIWAFLVFSAALLARFALSLKYPLRFLTWLFDPDEHPIKIIGIMLAAFVWAGVIIIHL